MKTHLVICALLLTGLLVTQPQLPAQDQSRHTLPDDAIKAWAELETVHQALRPPEEWLTKEPKPEQVAKFQKHVRQTAASFAESVISPEVRRQVAGGLW